MTGMERVACNLCGSDQAVLAWKLTPWQVVRCRRCGLLYLNPRPTAEELTRLYTADYFDQAVSPDAQTLYQPQTDADLNAVVRAQQFRLDLVTRWVTGPGRRLLDVGCATGTFLACARQSGWDGQGIEVAEWAVRQATSRLGVPVISGDLDHAPLPTNYYDVVTLFHVLEHYADPLGSLRRIYQLLRPGGIIAIEAPDLTSFDSRRLGITRETLRLPYHLYHFTARTLPAMLTRAGFVWLETFHPLSTLLRPRRSARSEYVAQSPRGRWRDLLRGIVRGTLGRFLTGRDMVVIGRR